MEAYCSTQTAVLSDKGKTCGMWHGTQTQPSCEAFAVPHGVRVVQNGRPMLEDAFSQAVIDVQAAAAVQSDGAAVSTGAQQPLAFFGVYDGHGGAEVAHHAASKLHQHFQAAYKQLATAAQLAGANSGSACSANSSMTLEEMLCDPWNSSSSNTMESNVSSDGSPAGTLADVLARNGPAASPADLSCSSPSASSNGSSPTCQQVWATINGPAAAALPPGNSLRQQQQQHPSRASRVVVQALREAFLRTDTDLAGTEVGEVVGTTAVTAVLSQGELFIGHCGDSRAVLCRKGQAVPLTTDHKPGRADEMARVSQLGGKIVFKAGSHRVMGLLAMSRALGDHFLRPYVIAEPEVLCLQRCPDDELLILATDGLWDVFSCQEATTLALRSTIRARQRGASSSAACRVGASVLVRGAIERGSRDNITVAVIDLRRRDDDFASVASFLASQCSSDLSSFAVGAGSRKRRSSSGNDDTDGLEGEHLDIPAPLAHHSSICTGSTFNTALHSSALHPHNALAVAAAGGSIDPPSGTRRHTTNSALEPGGLSSAGGGPGAGSSGGRGPGVSWGWSLQGLHILPHSQDNPSSSIRALAQAAAAAVAAFSGTMSSANRSVSGIPREVTTAGPSNTAAAAAGRLAPKAAAGAGGVAAPVTPTLADLLSMQSAPMHGRSGRSSGGGKPPLPQPRGV